MKKFIPINDNVIIREFQDSELEKKTASGIILTEKATHNVETINGEIICISPDDKELKVGYHIRALRRLNPLSELDIEGVTCRIICRDSILGYTEPQAEEA